MKNVAIVDYGMGNLDSVVRAVEECGGSPRVVSQPGDLENATSIVLPGVGAFDNAIRKIRERRLDTALGEQVIDHGIPFLGICLGMQLLATAGYEGKETPGLGWIEGEVRRLEPDTQTERLPHVGWNEVVFVGSPPLFEGIPSGRDFYFVHSYHFVCRNKQHIVANTPYCGGFVSALARDNIFGVQFHPEKSQRLGFRVIKNFLAF